VSGTLPGPSRQRVEAALGSGQRPRRRGAPRILTESALPRNAERSRGYFWRRELRSAIRAAWLLESCVPVNILLPRVRSKSHPIKYLSALPRTEKQMVTDQAEKWTIRTDLFFLSTLDNLS
jgi:hypothetical protein